jgi:hypothetical protein
MDKRKLNRRPRKLDDSQVKRMIEAYNMGALRSDLCRRFDICESSFFKYLRRYKLEQNRS